jgi:hypothetical protein
MAQLNCEKSIQCIYLGITSIHLSSPPYRTCGIYGREDRCIWSLVQKPEGKTQLRRPKFRWEGSIKMDLQEVG